MKKEVLLTAAIAIGSSVAIENANAMKPSWAKKGMTVVKCKGIAKKGKNDCGANAHGCGGNAKVNNDPNEWIYMPEGLCEKITGGKVLSKKKASGTVPSKKKASGTVPSKKKS